MAHEYLNKVRVVSHHVTNADGAAYGPCVLSTTGDKFAFAPATPIDVYRWGVIVSTALDATGGFTAALDFRPTVDSDTNRVEVQTIVRASGTTAAGLVLFKDVILPVAQTVGEDALDPTSNPAMPKSLIDVGPAGPLLVNPGQQIVIEVTDGATAGEGFFFVEFVEHDFAGSRVATAINAGP